jgi:hypothetical protein
LLRDYSAITSLLDLVAMPSKLAAVNDKKGIKRVADAPANGLVPAAFVDTRRCKATIFPKGQCKYDALVGAKLCKLHGRMEREGTMKRPRVDAETAAAEGEAGPAEEVVEGAPAAIAEAAEAADVPEAAMVAEAAAAAMQGFPAPPAALDELWQEMWGEVSAMANPNSPELDELKQYVRFTELFKQQLSEAGLPMLETPLGVIGGSEQQLAAYLCYRRFHQVGRKQCEEKPLSGQQLYKLMGKIRSGAGELGHIVKLPDCLVAQQPYSLWLKKRLAAWAVEDAKHFQKPAQEKVAVTGRDIEKYCINLIVDSQTRELTDKELCGGLLLRIQSATNLRSGNLCKDLRWKDACSDRDRGHYGSIQVVNTKRLTAANHDLGKLVNMVGRASRYFDDDISGNLFQLWCRRHGAVRQGDDYFFPMVHHGHLEWSKPLSNTSHNEMVRTCVKVLQLAPDNKLVNYSSTCIRRGNQETTEAMIQRFRAQRNLDMGWAKESWVGPTHYTPDNVAVAPGPLFWDVADCNARLQYAMADEFLIQFTAVLCKACGSPSCTCLACMDLVRRGMDKNPKDSHSCWRQQKGSKAGRMVEIATDRLKEAWAEHHCDLGRAFHLRWGEAGFTMVATSQGSTDIDE